MKDRNLFTVSADLPLDAESYFVERDSAPFRSLLSSALKIGTMSFTESWALEDGGTAVRLVTSPDFGAWVPKALQSQASFQKLEFHDVAQPPLNGTGTGVQIISYEPAELTKPPYSLPVRTESPMLGHKLDVQLRLMIQPTSATSCRQTLEGTIRVKVFGLGKIVEGIIRDQLAATYRQLPDIVAKWCEFRSQCLASGASAKLVGGRPAVGTSVPWIAGRLAEYEKAPPGSAQEGSEAATPPANRAVSRRTAASFYTPAATEYLDAEDSGSAAEADEGLAGVSPSPVSTGRPGPDDATPAASFAMYSADEDEALRGYWTSVTGRPASSRSSFTQFAKDTGNVVRESFNTASVGFLLGLTSSGLVKIRPPASSASTLRRVEEDTQQGTTPRLPSSGLSFSAAGALVDMFVRRASGQPLDVPGIVAGHHHDEFPGTAPAGDGRDSSYHATDAELRPPSATVSTVTGLAAGKARRTGQAEQAAQTRARWTCGLCWRPGSPAAAESTA